MVAAVRSRALVSVLVVLACALAQLAVAPDVAAAADAPPVGEGAGGPVDRADGDTSTAASGVTGGASAHTMGAWGPVQAWPLGAIHAIVLPDGRVMTYGTNGKGRPSYGFSYDTWDPVTGTHTTLPVGTATNLFCSAQTVLPWSGQVLITGGDENGLPGGGFNDAVNDVNVFDPQDDSLRRLASSTAHARWYPTTTVLPDGEVLVHGGRDDQPKMRPSTTPEVYSPDTGWRRLTSARSDDVYGSGRWWYPRSWVAPNGKVFIVTKGNRGLWMLDTSGRGAMKRVGTYPGPSTNNTTPAAMFDEGKVLITRADGKASVIDINGSTPKVRETGALRSYRAWSNATVLADGEVLVTGGASRHQELKYATKQAEIWNPDTGRWRTGAKASKARLYHSSAILLPDATVLTAGGGPPGPVTNLNAEIYHPPYLFRSDGSGRPAERPTITGVGDVRWGRSFAVDVADGQQISRVTLVRTGSNTHSFDMDQRFLDLDFAQAGGELTVQAPRNNRVAPPGRYMVFVFDEAGVPSVARIVQLNETAAPGPQGVQTGTMTLAQLRAGRWVDVAFERPFERTPVVAVGAPSGNSADPITARVRNVTTEGFELQLAEWSNLDGRHSQETVSFIAAEPGRHTLGGVTLEAGAVTADGTWRTAGFADRFAGTPVVLPQVSSDRQTTVATVRLRGVNAGGFQLRLQEHEARDRAGRRHGQETVAYIALSGVRGEIAGVPFKVGATRVNVTDAGRTLRFGIRLGAPVLVAAAQTAEDGDPVTLRYRGLSSKGARVWLQEERSRDRETRHRGERVGWVVIGRR